MSNFVNFHVLISHSPACLNRDDMNMQKDAVFGGKRRVRISSQSLKRAIRTSDYYASHIGEPSIRTINISALREQLQTALEGKHSPDLIDQTIKILSGRTDADFSQEEKITGDAVTPWVVGEVDWFCAQIAQGNADGLDERKLIKSLKSDLQAMHRSLEKGVDVALSGRMATSGLMSEVGKVDGAMSIAHAITTHAVDSDLDWFTAVDDLQELGSAHLGTQEFSAGVFYRYASLNLSQLQENLGGASRAKALEIAAHLAHMLATEVPNAKQRTFAAFNPADLVLVNFSDVPVSLANAFESPIKARQEGYLKPSVEALSNYWNRVAAGYGLTSAAAQFSLVDAEAPAGVTTRETLVDLKNWIKNNGEG